MYTIQKTRRRRKTTVRLLNDEYKHSCNQDDKVDVMAGDQNGRRLSGVVGGSGGVVSDPFRFHWWFYLVMGRNVLA